LQEICENIFEDLKKLVKARNDPVQRLSVDAQNQSLNNWFQELIKTMEEVEIRRHKLYLSNYPFFLDASSLITFAIKEDLNISWLT